MPSIVTIDNSLATNTAVGPSAPPIIPISDIELTVQLFDFIKELLFLGLENNELG